MLIAAPARVGNWEQALLVLCNHHISDNGGEKYGDL